jgi:hypothetical protein
MIITVAVVTIRTFAVSVLPTRSRVPQSRQFVRVSSVPFLCVKKAGAATQTG